MNQDPLVDTPGTTLTLLVHFLGDQSPNTGVEVFLALFDLFGDKLGDARVADGTQVRLSLILVSAILSISEGDVLAFGAFSLCLGSTCLITSQLRFNFFGRRRPQSTRHRRGLLWDGCRSTDDDRRLGHLASWLDLRGWRRWNLGLRIGREFGNGAHEGTLVPFLTNENLIDTSGMDGESNEGEFTWGHFRSDTGCMGLVPSGISIRGEDDKVDGRLRSGELDDLLEEATPYKFTRWRTRDVKPNLQRDQTVSAIVGNPQGLDPGVIVDVAKHIWVLFGAVDKFEGGKDVLCDNGEQLEHGAVPAADDDAIVDKGQRGWKVVSTDAVCPEWTLVMNVPQRQGRVLGNGGQRKVRNIKVKRNQALPEWISRWDANGGAARLPKG